MKSYYSIISAVVRPEIQEKISIGLLLVSPGELFFSYSKNKISAVKTLLDHSLFKFLNDTLRQIEASVSTENTDKAGLFQKDEPAQQFSMGYLSYMNRYSNNLINFSAPVEIDLPANVQLYDFLFSKYIDSTVYQPKKTKSIEKIKEEFYPQVKNYFNTEKEITPNEVQNLPMTVKVDIIGENEVPVFGQLIDFERQNNFIFEDIAVLKFLLDAFDYRAQSFIIGNEPDRKSFPKSHDTWSNLRNWKKSSFIELDQIGAVKEYAEEHGVHPFCN
jgi:hypothetical protein